MSSIARPLPPPPDEEIITPERPIPVMMTMTHEGQEWDLPAILEAWTSNQLVRIYWVHPRTRQAHTHWVPSSAIRKSVERKPGDGPIVTT